MQPISRHPLFCLFFLLLLAGSLTAQQQEATVTFTASADGERILLGSYLNVTFTLANAQGTEFALPAIEGAEVVSGPASSVRTSIINGAMSSQASYAYVLKPERTGTLTIPPATIRANGRTFRTNPLRVEVLKADAASAALAPNIKLVADLSTATAYVGQQIVLDYKLYTTTDVETINPMQESDYAGFFSQEVRQFDGRVYREVLDGKQYYVKILKRLVIFPQRSGRLEITPYRAMLGIPEGERQANNGFFFSRRRRQEPAETRPVFVNVKELPAPAPPEFSGAVGRYTFTADLSNDEITTDDALTLLLTVRGEGDLERVQAPDPGLSADWEVYDGKLLDEEWVVDPTGVYGRKSFEFPLVPRRPGQFTVTPTFTYFNVDSARYVKAESLQFRVRVRPGTNLGTDQVNDELTVADSLARAENRPRMAPDAASLNPRRYGSSFLGGGLYWMLVLLPFLGLGFLWLRDRRRAQLAGRDPEQVRRQRAVRMATDRLKRARAHQADVNDPAYFAEISQALLGYVADKLRIPTSELSKTEVHRRLVDTGVSFATADRYVDLLKRCEIALYAGGGRTAAERADLYDQARMLIVGTEKELGGVNE